MTPTQGRPNSEHKDPVELIRVLSGGHRKVQLQGADTTPLGGTLQQKGRKRTIYYIETPPAYGKNYSSIKRNPNSSIQNGQNTETLHKGRYANTIST